MATTKKTTKAEPYEWLMAKTRLGRRIERLGWRRLGWQYLADRGYPVRCRLHHGQWR